MRAFAAVVLIILLGAVQAPAQRGGGHTGGGGGRPGGGGGFVGHPGITGGHPGVVVTAPPFRDFGSRTGFGNILAPGVGNLPPLEPNQFFAYRFGASVSGFPGYRGFKGYPVYSYPYYSYPLYNYPLYTYPPFDPYAYGYGNYAQPATPNVTIVVPPQAVAPPVNIYEQPEPAQPMIREYPPYGEQPEQPQDSSVRTYRAPSYSRPAPSTDEIRFFIPLKDNSVYTAVAYWVEGDMLHYITPDGRHNQVSLDLVDRPVAERLNRGGKAEFRLPPAKK